MLQFPQPNKNKNESPKNPVLESTTDSDKINQDPETLQEGTISSKDTNTVTNGASTGKEEENSDLISTSTSANDISSGEIHDPYTRTDSFIAQEEHSDLKNKEPPSDNSRPIEENLTIEKGEDKEEPPSEPVLNNDSKDIGNTSNDPLE